MYLYIYIKYTALNIFICTLLQKNGLACSNFLYLIDSFAKNDFVDNFYYMIFKLFNFRHRCFFIDCNIILISRVRNKVCLLLQCDVVFTGDRNLTYECQYVPTMEGEYTVSCTQLGTLLDCFRFIILYIKTASF